MKKKRSGLGWGFRLLIVLFAGVLLLIAFVVLYKQSLDRQIESRLKAVRAAGYPVTCMELEAWHEYPPAGDNAADVLVEAFSYYDKWDRKRLKQLPIVGDAKLPECGKPMDGQMKQLIEQFLKDNEDALQLLHKGAGIKHSRYPVDLTQGYCALFPSLGEVRHGAKLLRLEAIIHTANNETELAVQSVIDIFGLARSLAREPVIISHLVKTSCDSIGIYAMEDVIEQNELNDKYLKQLDIAIAEALDGEGLERAFIAERCMVSDVFVMPELYHELLGWPHPDILNLYKAAGLMKREHLLYLDFMDDYIGIFKLPPPERIEAAEDTENKVDDIRRKGIILREVMPALGRIVVLDIRAKAKSLTARAMLAVERYWLKYNKLPESTTELVGDYLEAVPIDPFDGQPLRYKRLEKGYIVYSVGEDQEDNGGVEKLENGNRGWGRDGTDITFRIER